MLSLSSIIGQASRGADLYFVFRFLRLLTMKYTSTNAYKLGIIDINGIPRFMLFDENGNVISLDAPRPSSDKIRGLIDTNLLIKSILLN